MKKPSVLILGGGIAGLTAAHELIERGYDVTVIESHGLVGGKAKSIGAEKTGRKGRKDLPAEHGFRIFPGFYQHLMDTMRRIPYQSGSTKDNLLTTKEVYIGDAVHGSVRMPNTFWGTIQMPVDLLRGRHFLHKMGVSQEEMEFFATKLWQVLTTCPERRDRELDTISWWEFTEASKRSKAYQDQLVVNTTKTLVASDPWHASARTIGGVAIQVLRDVFRAKSNMDRVLNGPTNEVWIDPWHEELVRLGVTFVPNHTVEHIELEENQIMRVSTKSSDGTTDAYHADAYVLAVPVEVAAELLKPHAALDNQFTDLQELATKLNWMNGIQFYFYTDVPIAAGHEILPKTKWALTSISQAQFWKDFDWNEYGDGTVNGVLSVDISDWHVPGGLHKKTAIECTPKEIAEEVWWQLKRAINTDEELLSDKNLHSWFLDPDIQRSHMNPHENINLEPLLVNLVNTWELRPEVATKIPNLYLAADYVKNNTDLATMEGANESARRAVNYIRKQLPSAVASKPCKVFPMREPWYARILQSYDRRRLQRGLPWNPRPPFWLFWPILLLIIFYKIGLRIAR